MLQMVIYLIRTLSDIDPVQVQTTWNLTSELSMGLDLLHMQMQRMMLVRTYCTSKRTLSSHTDLDCPSGEMQSLAAMTILFGAFLTARFPVEYYAS
jgi:hypothetical protein